VQIDIPGDERGDNKDDEDGADPQKSDYERVMTASPRDWLGYGFVHLRAHSYIFS
jgi:hypothetical protein